MSSRIAFAHFLSGKTFFYWYTFKRFKTKILTKIASMNLARTQMTVQLDEDRLVSKTGQRMLSVDEVSAVMKQALDEDLDGTVYAIMPNMPPIKVPNFNYSMLLPVYLVASTLFKNSASSVDANRVLAGLFLALMLLSFLMGFSAYYMMNMLI